MVFRFLRRSRVFENDNRFKLTSRTFFLQVPPRTRKTTKYRYALSPETQNAARWSTPHRRRRFPRLSQKYTTRARSRLLVARYHRLSRSTPDVSVPYASDANSRSRHICHYYSKSHSCFILAVII